MTKHTDHSELRTIDQVIAAAAEAIAPPEHTWAASGAGEGITVARNSEALSKLALIPRVLRDVSEIDLETSFTGIPLGLPVVLAPVAALALYDEEDAAGAARAAADASTSLICSVLTTSPWEDVAATAPGRHLLGLYVFGDRTWVGDIVDHAEDAGFGGICVTVDTPRIGRRDRALEGYVWLPAPQGLPSLEEHGPWDNTYRASYTADDLAWLCERTRLPVTVKGIMTPEDADIAVDCGVAAVYVSNHGGRQVDHGLSTIEVLEEVSAAVPDHVGIAVDGGFTRGPEICKALALGADVVAIGRLQCWGLAAGGPAGLSRVFDILTEELEITMANLGAADVRALERDQVRWSIPVSGDR